MEPEQTLIEAVRAQPDDDAPRLAYAAWLRERGDPRGEFIDAQVRWQQARRVGDYAEMVRQAARERPLLQQHRAAWLAAAEALGLYNAEFRRGFVESAGIEAPKFFKNAERLFEPAPLLRDLTFYHEGPDLLPRLAECPALLRLEALTLFNCGILTDALDTLAASPYAANLRSLSLQQSRLAGPAIADVCVKLLALPRLSRFRLNWAGVCPRGLRQRLPPTPPGDEVVTALAQSPNFSRLRTFGASNTGITDAAVAAIARSPYLACADELDLGYNAITDAAAQALADSPRSACLTKLGVWNTQVGNAGLATLIQSPHLGSLHNLSIGWRITDPGMRALAAAPASARLRTLDLSCNRQLNVAGAEALAASEHLANLEMLDLRDTKVGSRGALALLRSTWLPGLKWLIVGTEGGGGWDNAVVEAMQQRFGYLC